MSKRITRDALVETVANSLSLRYQDDLPAIRQALNDTADSYRKDGYTVGDYAQDRMVRDVRLEMTNRLKLKEARSEWWKRKRREEQGKENVRERPKD